MAFLPIPRTDEEWRQWASKLISTLENRGLVAQGSGAAGVGGAAGGGGNANLPITDSQGRVILDSDGHHVFDASGVEWITPSSVQINTGKLIDAAITTQKLANSAVDVDKLADLAVEASKLADSSVESTKIANAAVGSAAIANLAVGNAQIDDLAVTSGKIGDLEVLEAKIADLAVGNAKIADLAVTSAKIKDLAVDEAKINDLAVSNFKINGSAVDTPKIASNSVVNNLIDERTTSTTMAEGDSAVIGEVSFSAPSGNSGFIVQAGAVFQCTDSDGSDSRIEGFISLDDDGTISDVRIFDPGIYAQNGIWTAWTFCGLIGSASGNITITTGIKQSTTQAGPYGPVEVNCRFTTVQLGKR